MKKLLVATIVILLITLNIPNLAEKNTVKANSSVLENPSLSFRDIAFNLKIRLMLRLAHIISLSACIIKDNTIVWSQGYGFSNRAMLEKPTLDTIYMVGSISKVITATALMQLYENESYDFNLDDNVSKWLPFDLKNPQYPDINITFRMLLAHQSSLHDHDQIDSYSYIFSNYPYSYLEEILMPYGEDYHPEFWGNYSPGDGANYSNLGFILVGYIIERMTGITLEEYCQENIFKPLEMKSTSFNMSNLDKPSIAVPYQWVRGRFIRQSKYDYTFVDPCGGLYTTAEDLSHLLIAHLNGGVYNNAKILNSSSLDLMHTVQYPDSMPYFNRRYGLGWIVIEKNDEPYRMGHSGSVPYYIANMGVLIPDNISVIYFYNSEALPLPLIPDLSSKRMRYWKYYIEDLLFEKAGDFV